MKEHLLKEQLLMDEIAKKVINCSKCRLCETALNGVPGEGNISAELVFIGEAPGANEDATGRPFVGRAGNLLDKLLNKIGYEREDVWIGNVVKHRPPKNRDPLPDEIKACEPYLNAQLGIIKPKLVVTLGRFALNYFHPEGKISKDHGKLITLPLYNVFPVYHPAAALRNGNFAESLVKDFMQIPGILEKVERKGSNPLGL